MKKLVPVFLMCFQGLMAQTYSSLPLKDFGKSGLLLVINKSRFAAFPHHFEETDSVMTIENADEKSSVTAFSIFSERSHRAAGGFKKMTDKNGVISLVRNDTLTSRFDRNSESSVGVIAGKSGTVVRQLIPRASDKLPATEKYTLREDTTHYLIFKPEFNLVEVECGSLYERRYLFGELYNSILAGLNKMEPIRPLNTKLKPGDEMQITFKARQLDLDKLEFTYEPVQLMHIKVLPGIVPTELAFERYSTDIKSSTIYDRHRGTFLITEGYCITDGQVFLKDSAYTPDLKILPFDTPIRMHPFIPALDLSGPQIEAYWQSPGDEKSKSLSTMSYWNSAVPSRIVYVPEFPIPWKDAGDGYIGELTYMQTGDYNSGHQSKADKNKDLHFEEVAIKGDSIFLDIFNPSKNAASLHFEANGEKLALRKKLELKKGANQVVIQMSELRAAYAGFLVLSELKGEEAIEKQRFKLSPAQ
ncbi:MAG: hypothetical protein R2850_10550 [Bacteroidia bacterium]